MNIAPKTSFVLHHRHLLGIEGLSHDEIMDCSISRGIRRSQPPDRERSVRSLRGRTQINLFFEASTRTQSSFELAGKRLGADVMNMSVALVLDAQGRDADRHRDDAQRHAPRHPGGAPPCIRRGGTAGAQGRLLGDQCRRRRP